MATLLPTSVDPGKFKTHPYNHQVEGVQFLVDSPYAAVFDEPGLGKSKQMVDTACVLYEAGAITDVVVACPAGVKTVWTNLRVGEVALHVWVPSILNDWLSDSSTIVRKEGKLTWTVVSYEYLRSTHNVRRLMQQLKGHKVMLVADESIRLKGHKSQQTAGALLLRKVCDRAYILNGTPTGGNPLDLYCQMELLSPQILRCDNFYQFRNRHAIISRVKTKGGKSYPTIIGWQLLEVLKRQVKPYILRRLKKNCLDLPPKIYHVREVPFTEEAWRLYKEMRDQMIVYLSDDDAVVARQAITKLIRLRQLTCGFIMGTESGDAKPTSEEKLQAIVNWVEDVIEQDPSAAIIIWCSFRLEQERYAVELEQKYNVVRIYGGQDKDEREQAVEDFNLKRANQESKEPIILIGNQQAGGLGLNLTRSHWVAYSSNDFNLVNRIQSEDRVDRAGQTVSPNIFDFLTTGPQGQRTVDHAIFKALKMKNDVATWTAADWVKQLKNDEPEQFDYLAF
jgi:SNF2 family DNA or RNA helicase